MATSNGTKFERSPTVQKSLSNFSKMDAVRASDLAQSIIDQHKEYAQESLVNLKLRQSKAAYPIKKWLDDIQDLFDPDFLSPRTESVVEPPVLHGRLFLICLCLLDPPLRQDLETGGAFSKLVGELKEPLPEILGNSGKKLLDAGIPSDSQLPPREHESVSDVLESVPNWTDDPIGQIEHDLLGRAAFARFLGRHLNNLPEDSKAYSIHVFGPWGSGKSSLLNFLKEELQGPLSNRRSYRFRRFLQRFRFRRKLVNNEDEWVVVEFNAWAHQHIRPPWWSLMERVFNVTKRRLSYWSLCREYWWRLNSGRWQYVLAAVVFGLFFAYFVLPRLLSGVTSDQTQSVQIKAIADAAENLSKITALVATVWGAVFAFSRSLLFSSAEAAQTYTKLTHDPANQIKRRFNKLIERLKPVRIAIFIDDVDRCQSQYVVDLLEGIQTLYRDAPVVFLVAADRHWLNACYEEIYDKLKPHIFEPGKSLGSLFLEKAFRFSTSLPGVPDNLRNEYWLHLLNIKQADWKSELDSARKDASQELSTAQNESQIRALAEKREGRSLAQQRAFREESVVQLASPRVARGIEHALRPYVSLLEPNPRAMKLLVNSYSANRALALLSELEIDLHHLALWTIICSRWPELADDLANDPESLDRLRAGDGSRVTEKLKPLYADMAVSQVINGGEIKTRFSKEALEKCARIRL